MDLIINTDGASRGNPGLAGIGAVISNSKGELVGKICKFLGKATNNQAEYEAIIAGLKAARKLTNSKIIVRSDSELVVRQLRGDYSVNNPILKTLHNNVKMLEKCFKEVIYEHIRRDLNELADELANKGIDDECSG